MNADTPENMHAEQPRLFRRGEMTVSVRLEEGEDADAAEALLKEVTEGGDFKQAPNDGTERPHITILEGAEGQRYAYATVITELEDTDLLDLCYEVYTRTDQGEDTRLSASPNWLMSAAQPGGHPVGGPGAMPVPATRVAPGAYRFIVPGSLQGRQIQGSMEKLLEAATRPGTNPVHVAILDTIPSVHALATAVHTFTGNDLLQSFAASNPQLSYMPFDLMLDTLHPQDGAHMLGSHHDQLFSDHGLFVAGIVHTLAPNARLHLIQVLNDYAAGTLDSLVWGFNHALATTPADQALIINCSLTLSIPNNLALLKEAGVDSSLVRYFIEKERNDPTFIGWLGQAAHTAVATVASRPQTAIIAAAGNEGDQTTARYPGAYREVYGVGALTHNMRRAGYSNVADTPIGQGFAAYGGDADPDGKANATTGMLGLYIGTFPDTGQPSTNGWGRWAGTSFASPVVAGLAAGLCGQGLSPGDANRRLRDMLIGEGSHLPDILPIHQVG